MSDPHSDGLPIPAPDRAPEPDTSDSEAGARSLARQADIEDLDRALERARSRGRRHLLWLLLGISPAAIVPALGLMIEGSVGLLVLLVVLVLAYELRQWVKAGNEAREIEEELKALLLEEGHGANEV